MSAAHFLFGDFSVVYRSSLPVAEAAGRLAATADESLPPRAAKAALLHGYATRNEVLLYQGNTTFINPFRPRFSGAFDELDGVAVLKGKFVASRFLKVWLAFGLLMSLAMCLAMLFPQHVHISGSPWAALFVVTAFLAILRLAMHPASPYIRSLERSILSAIAGEGPNSSFKGKPLRGSP